MKPNGKSKWIIEKRDIGKPWPDQNGFPGMSITFTAADVGQTYSKTVLPGGAPLIAIVETPKDE